MDTNPEQKVDKVQRLIRIVRPQKALSRRSSTTDAICCKSEPLVNPLHWHVRLGSSGTPAGTSLMERISNQS